MPRLNGMMQCRRHLSTPQDLSGKALMDGKSHLMRQSEAIVLAGCAVSSITAASDALLLADRMGFVATIEAIKRPREAGSDQS
jgi:hypothetical protein